MFFFRYYSLKADKKAKPYQPSLMGIFEINDIPNNFTKSQNGFCKITGTFYDYLLVNKKNKIYNQ